MNDPEHPITREQIISISAHEKGVHDDDMDGEPNRDVDIVLFYTDYSEPQFQSLADLQFSFTKDNRDWETVQQERLGNKSPKDLVFLT